MTFYKPIYGSRTIRNYCLVEGLNVDPRPYNKEIYGTGIHFYDRAQIVNWSKPHTITEVAIIEVPPDCPKETNGDIYKAERVIIKQFVPFEQWDVLNDISYCHFLMRTCPGIINCNLSNWRNMPKLSIAVVTKTPEMLRKITDQTEDICVAAVSANGLMLEYVEVQTNKICLAAVRQNGYAIKFVEKITDEISLAAVNQNGSSLQYIENQNDEICLAAVKQDGYALRFVKKMNYQICLAAIKSAPYLLYLVPAEMQTDELCILALKSSDYEDFEVVASIKNPSNELINKLIEIDFRVIKYLKNLTRENYALAFSKSAEAISYVNNPNLEMYVLAIETNHFSYRYIPKQVKIDNPNLMTYKGRESDWWI